MPSSSGPCCAVSGVGTWTCYGLHHMVYKAEDEGNMQRKATAGVYREMELNSIGLPDFCVSEIYLKFSTTCC